MFHQQVVEFPQCLIAVLAPGQGHFLEHERVTADGTLAEDHQVARKNVGAFDGDEDRRPLPVAPQIVVWPHDDGLAAVHVHGVLDALAATLGEVVLEDRRQHRRLLAQVHGLGGQQPCAVHQPGIAADACQRLLDTFEGSQGNIELFAYVGVLASDQARVLGSAGTHCGQGDGAADRQAVHQHHPALAEHGLATDEEIQRHEYVLAAVGAVHERGAQWQVAFADFDAGRVGRDQRQADTQFFLLAQQVVRVVGLERQAQQGGDGPEGDIALFPVQAQADDLFAVPLPLADHPGVRHGASIGAGQRASEGEAGDFIATRQAWQVVVALFVSAVMQQQFGRAERVGHHHGGGQVAAAGGQFHRHLGVCVG